MCNGDSWEGLGLGFLDDLGIQSRAQARSKVGVDREQIRTEDVGVKQTHHSPQFE
jgi:hypothetical protein